MRCAAGASCCAGLAATLQLSDGKAQPMGQAQALNLPAGSARLWLVQGPVTGPPSNRSRAAERYQGSNAQRLERLGLFAKAGKIWSHLACLKLAGLRQLQAQGFDTELRLLAEAWTVV